MVSAKIKGDGSLATEHIVSYLGNQVSVGDVIDCELLIIEAVNFDLDFQTPLEISQKLLAIGLDIQIEQMDEHKKSFQEIHLLILSGTKQLYSFSEELNA